MIELKNISSGYGKKEVIHNLSVSFEKGTLTSIIGPNGCGKSTLLKTILGIHPNMKGEIFLDGQSMSYMKRNEIAKHMAYLAQGKNVPDMTVEQMVLHGRFPHLSYPRKYTNKDREIAYSAMKKMEISDASKIPVSFLSGGMRQNAYIAMALAQDTEYILLDEPTTYLDISHQISLIKILRNLAENGKGIIAVMHDLPLVLKFSDRIVVMNEGKTVFRGTPQEVYNSGAIENVFGVSLNSNGDIYHYQY